MNYATTRNKTKILRAVMYLEHEGFIVGQTKNGFVAVDDDGIVIQATPYRTSAQVFHPTLKIYREEYALYIQEPYWFAEKVQQLVELRPVVRLTNAYTIPGNDATKAD